MSYLLNLLYYAVRIYLNLVKHLKCTFFFFSFSGVFMSFYFKYLISLEFKCVM